MTNTCVVFQTATSIDPRSFTTFGINAKPNTTSPIGYFGTGLKYAIAVLVREGIPVKITSGNAEWEFYTKSANFREQDFDIVRVKHRVKHRDHNKPKPRWSYKELPFTTELGKNWELWQAFRELESNTRDENGTTSCCSLAPDLQEIVPDLQEIAPDLQDETPSSPFTLIVIESPEFVQQYLDRNTLFLPHGSHLRTEETGSLQVFDEPSKYLYYRGMRVYDLPKVLPSQFTYNMLDPMDLTEDRTLKYQFLYASKVGAFVSTCRDEELIEKVVTASGDDFWEGKIDWDNYRAPSREFLDVMGRLKKARVRVLGGAMKLYRQHHLPPPLLKKPTAERLALEDVILRLKRWTEDPTSVDELRLQRLVKRAIPQLQIRATTLKDREERVEEDLIF